MKENDGETNIVKKFSQNALSIQGYDTLKAGKILSNFQQILETGTPGWSAYNLVNIFEISEIHNVQAKNIYCLLTTLKHFYNITSNHCSDILALLHGKIAPNLI